MYEAHPNLITPNDSEVIWRYFDFAGFLSLIANSTLYFRRCDKFEDNWDARYSVFPKLENAAYPDDKTRTRTLRSALVQQEFLRCTMFANCWHMSQHEDAAMWEVYTARKSGIAIQSNIGRLKESLQKCSRKMFIGKVVYGDFAQPDLVDPNNALPPSFVKREEYKFEKEVRVLVWSIMPHGPLSHGEPVIARDATGFPCPVEVDRLIESIFIAPALPPQMVTSVQHLMQKCGLGYIPVRQSKLAELPPMLADFDSHDPKVFTLSLRMEEPMLKLLIQVCDDFHNEHCEDMTAPVEPVELLNAVRKAAWDAGYR